MEYSGKDNAGHLSLSFALTSRSPSRDGSWRGITLFNSKHEQAKLFIFMVILNLVLNARSRGRLKRQFCRRPTPDCSENRVSAKMFAYVFYRALVEAIQGGRQPHHVVDTQKDMPHNHPQMPALTADAARIPCVDTFDTRSLYCMWRGRSFSSFIIPRRFMSNF